jgi:hypothetical protein
MHLCKVGECQKYSGQGRIKVNILRTQKYSKNKIEDV